MELGTILVVEDCSDDVFFLRRALAKAQVINPVQVVVDGQEAIDYLAGTEQYANRHEFPVPVLILLDLKLPRVDGFEVLAWLRQQASLSAIPVVILSSSSEERDRKMASKLGAQAYLVKPPDEAMMRQLFQSFGDTKQAFTGFEAETPRQSSGNTLGVT